MRYLPKASFTLSAPANGVGCLLLDVGGLVGNCIAYFRGFVGDSIAYFGSFVLGSVDRTFDGFTGLGSCAVNRVFAVVSALSASALSPEKTPAAEGSLA